MRMFLYILTNNNPLLPIHLQIPNTVQLQPVTTSMQPSMAAPGMAPTTTTTTTVVLQPKPVTLEKINPMPANPVSPTEFKNEGTNVSFTMALFNRSLYPCNSHLSISRTTSTWAI